MIKENNVEKLWSLQSFTPRLCLFIELLIILTLFMLFLGWTYNTHTHNCQLASTAITESYTIASIMPTSLSICWYHANIIPAIKASGSKAATAQRPESPTSHTHLTATETKFYIWPPVRRYHFNLSHSAHLSLTTPGLICYRLARSSSGSSSSSLHFSGNPAQPSFHCDLFTHPPFIYVCVCVCACTSRLSGRFILSVEFRPPFSVHAFIFGFSFSKFHKLSGVINKFQ